MRRARLALAWASLFVACGGDGDEHRLDVFAAASLTDAFGVVEAAFEEAHPDVDVVLNLAGSSALREQIIEGAPAEVFASADPSNVEQVVDAGAAAGVPARFAANELVIAVPPGNPARITGLGDFDDPDLLIGLCAAGVPCGDLAREALAEAGVTPSVDTEEPDVRSLLTKVAEGEVDAGIVYRTDVIAGSDDVGGIDIPREDNAYAHYTIVAVDDGEDADAFVAFVTGGDGRAILASFGFAPP